MKASSGKGAPSKRASAKRGSLSHGGDASSQQADPRSDSSQGIRAQLPDFAALLQNLGTDAVVGHAQRIVSRALEPIKPIAKEILCIIAQPELDTPALRNFGFLEFSRPLEHNRALEFNGESAEGPVCLIVLSFGEGSEEAKRILANRQITPKVPPVIVVMFVPFAGCPSIAAIAERGYVPNVGGANLAELVSVETCIRICRNVAATHATLFEVGADDVVCLLAGEKLSPQTLLTSANRSVFMDRRVKEVLDKELKEYKQLEASRMQKTFRKILLQLPGRCLDLPAEDKSMAVTKEESSQSVTGVGPYTVGGMIMESGMGALHVAHHKDHGDCMLRIVPKTDVSKRLADILQLDREVTIMTNLAAHPNVVKAHSVFNVSGYFICELEFAGHVHLQQYTRNLLERDNQFTLPRGLVEHLAEQMALAVDHMHGHLVVNRNLKTDNWIASGSEEAPIIQLGDFSLAVPIVGPKQMLKEACGSLPFCAPEVYRRTDERLRAPPEGYDGFAVDIWSLGLCFMELICGPYSIEQRMGWLPAQPTEPHHILQGLQSLPDRWAQALEEMERTSHLEVLVTQLLVLAPEERLHIGQVMAGLGLAPQQRPGRNFVVGHPRAATVATGNGSSDDSEAPFLDRLGGSLTLAMALSQALDRVSDTPGYRWMLGGTQEQTAASRTFYTEELVQLLGAPPGSADEATALARVEQVHRQLNVREAHVRLLAAFLFSSLRCLGAFEDAAAEARDALGRLAPAAAAGCSQRLADAAVRCTAIWRRGALATMRQPQVARYAECLASRLASSHFLAGTPLAGRSPKDIERAFLGVLSSESGQHVAWLPLLPGDVTPGSGEHLEVVELAGEAMRQSGWEGEVSETLLLLSLGAWETQHVEHCDR